MKRLGSGVYLNTLIPCRGPRQCASVPENEWAACDGAFHVMHQRLCADRMPAFSGNEIGVRYRPCAMHAFRIDRANVLFDPAHTHLDEPFAETEVVHVDADGNDSDSDSVVSVGGTTGPGLHSMINTLSSLLGQRRQPLRSPPPVPTPLRAGLSPMLAVSELPWIQEMNPLPATGANATPLSPVSLTLALRRPLRDDGDEPGTPLDADMGESDTGRRTPMPARRVRRKRSESIER
ncbi:hypothetical protein ACGC1H_001378 [Rhizoctonia solani]